MNFPKNFSYSEMIFSQTAARKHIDNTPPDSIVRPLCFVANNMELIRMILGDKVCSVSSGYRSPALNRAVGGSNASQHTKGEACDFTCRSFGNPKEVCEAIRDSVICFDKMIYEGSWVHISFSMEQARRQVYTAIFKQGQKTRYVKGITDGS